MNPIDRKKSDRFAFLEEIYKRTGGNRQQEVDEREIQRDLGWSEEQLEGVVGYLTAEGLVEYVELGYSMGITHDGIREYERAISAPDQASEYFPAVNIINVEKMENSQIQQGAVCSSQVMSVAADDVVAIRALLQETRAALAGLALSDEARQSIESDTGTIEAQLSNPHPKRSIIVECFSSVRHLLEAAGGHVLAMKIAAMMSGSSPLM
jgi:hypothetical protein